MDEERYCIRCDEPGSDVALADYWAHQDCLDAHVIAQLKRDAEAELRELSSHKAVKFDRVRNLVCISRGTEECLND